MTEPVVILVDNKHRDLDGAALIAHHLERRGIPCHLEPLEAFRAAVGAYRPGFLLFNHLTAGHLVQWSQRLKAMGVLTGVLPNEGIVYDDDGRRFDSGRLHKTGHIDHFFCWNEPHRDALIGEGWGAKTNIHVIGVPRFDFYFPPWAPVVGDRSSRPTVLFCTNFPLAKFAGFPKAHADAIFKGWLGIPRYRDYWQSIEASKRGQDRVFDYIDALNRDGRFNLIVRPHPGEDAEIYRARSSAQLDIGTNITGSILNADAVISCETCTTALEAWIAGKVHVTAIFERNPLFYYDEQASAWDGCDSPALLPDLLATRLECGTPPVIAMNRNRHLDKWVHGADGKAAERVAIVIAGAIRSKQPADWSQLTLGDYRRAAKLKLYRRIDQPYHFRPSLALKARLFPGRYAVRSLVAAKSIRPSDSHSAKRRIAARANAR
jgi:surface carbohydrate biosynthesis protein